jgi:hypothetical protein
MAHPTVLRCRSCPAREIAAAILTSASAFKPKYGGGSGSASSDGLGHALADFKLAHVRVYDTRVRLTRMCVCHACVHGVWVSLGLVAGRPGVRWRVTAAAVCSSSALPLDLIASKPARSPVFLCPLP